MMALPYDLKLVTWPLWTSISPSVNGENISLKVYLEEINQVTYDKHSNIYLLKGILWKFQPYNI